MSHKLRRAYLVDVRVIDESALNVLHVGTAAGQNDASEQLVAIFAGHLKPHVLDDFLHTALHYLDELAALHLSVGVDREAQGVVYVVVVGVCAAVFELHLLCVLELHLQRFDVFGDIGGSERYDGEVAQDVLAVDGDRRGVRSDVDEGASGAFLCLREYAVGESQRREEHLGDIDAGGLEALVEVLVECLALQDVEEVAFYPRALYAHGVELRLCVDLVFLHCHVEYLLVRILPVAVDVHQFDDHVLRDFGLRRQVPGYHVSHAAYGLSAHAHVDLCYRRLELRLQFADDVLDAQYGLVEVVDFTFLYENGRVLPHHGKHVDAAVEIFLSRDTGHLG